MAETWNKKELEKKKQKKKQDKEQRKEERKASAAKDGKSFDDMIAYVDENGNLSSTPPDPSKKRIIREQDITIGVPRQEAVKPEDLIRKGIVSFFNDSKGYGFIKDSETGDSIFVHMNGLIDKIKDNNKVTFEVESSPKGPNAVRVKLAL
ncbi:MAG: DNA-binding protein [Azospira oryzae]|jgi:cold shock CspA family protein|nr:MAG: DNA-binding protein [Azospira oryzae]